jgi:hypothetical protein
VDARQPPGAPEVGAATTTEAPRGVGGSRLGGEGSTCRNIEPPDVGACLRPGGVEEPCRAGILCHYGSARAMLPLPEFMMTTEQILGGDSGGPPDPGDRGRLWRHA